MENNEIVQFLDKKFPDQLPIKEISSYELGVLVGQQQVIKDLKAKLKYELEQEQEIK